MTPEQIRIPADGDDGALAVEIHAAPRPRGALIALHGFASSRRSTKAQTLAASLSAVGWTVLIPDLQGHGDSGGSFEGLSVARSIRDVGRVAALPAFASAPRRALLGSSFGGVVSAWAAAENPGLADRLILVAPAFGFIDRYVEAMPAAELAAWEAGGVHRAQTPIGPRDLGPDIVRERGERGVVRLARNLATRTLIVHGTGDESAAWQAAADFLGRVARPIADAVFLGGADHRLSGRLDDLCRLVRDFVDGAHGPSESPEL